MSGGTISEAVRTATAGSGIRGLRRRLVVSISILVVLVLAAHGAVLALAGSRHLRREIEERADAYATLAVGPVCDAYETYYQSDRSKFRQLVQELVGLNPDLERLAIYDAEGRLLFASDGLAAGGGERLRVALRGLERQVWSEEDAAGERRLVVVAPRVEEWRRHRCSVAFRFSYRGLRWPPWDFAGWIGGLALLALGAGVGVAIAYLLSTRRLASTIRDLEGSNERLARLNQDLLELDRTKSDLLANVSHELRTPLTTISGYVESMREGMLGELSPLQISSLEVVERNIGHLQAMIDQLLSYSRMASGRRQVELAPFDLEAVAAQVVEGVTAAHGGELDLRFICPPGLPEVYGDGGRIGQVIDNLLTNAIKFSPAGGRVDLTIRRVAGGVEVEVADRGIGIPEEHHEKIFDRFYQVDASSRRHVGGIGLGLAIVREILEANHSTIAVMSRPGEGSRFRFILPLAAEGSAAVKLRQARETGDPVAEGPRQAAGGGGAGQEAYRPRGARGDHPPAPSRRNDIE